MVLYTLKLNMDILYEVSSLFCMLQMLQSSVPAVLSSIPDRVPEMDKNWTFDTCSSLYAKEGA
jgi:hypothetical protein